MTSAEIVSLLGSVTAYVIGGVVFLVLFFKAISWAEAWMRRKTNLEKARHRKVSSKSKQKRRSTQPRSHSVWNSYSTHDLSPSSNQNASPSLRALSDRRAETAPRESIAAQRQRALQQKALQDLGDSIHGTRARAGLAALPKADDSQMIQVAASNENLIRSDLAPKDIASLGERTENAPSNQAQVVSEDKRVLSIQLTCGELIEHVSILASEQADLVRQQVGYLFGNNIVAKGQDGQVFVIREESIKLLVWGTERDRTSQHGTH